MVFGGGQRRPNPRIVCFSILMCTQNNTHDYTTANDNPNFQRVGGIK